MCVYICICSVTLSSTKFVAVYPNAAIAKLSTPTPLRGVLPQMFAFEEKVNRQCKRKLALCPGDLTQEGLVLSW